MTALRGTAARHWATLLIAPLVLAGGLTAAVPAVASAAPAVASAAGCIPVTGLPMPADPQGLDQVLNGAAVRGPCDAWAVGARGGSTVVNQTLTEHYDGSGWTIVPSPNAGQSGDGNVLAAVAAVSASDVWAVGSTTRNSTVQTLIEHWDGSSWTVSQSGIAGGNSTSLTAVTATSATDIWAVGVSFSQRQPLIEHYDGSSWTVIPGGSLPAGNTDGSLAGVTATSPADAWAVGTTTTSNFVKQTLVERWNGTRWTVFPSANPGPATASNVLTGVANLTSNNGWAVGTTTGSSGSQALIEHWNGQAWTPATIPAIGTSSGLNGMAATSDRNIWAVGEFESNGAAHTLAEFFDGNNWTVLPSPDGGQVSELLGAGTSSATSAWLVGAADGQTLAINCC
jgi:hypothetical protein